MKLCCLTSLLLGLTCIASAQSSAPSTMPSAPPAYTVLRYNEDYSYLKNSDARTDFFDPIKFIPLNDKGDWYASFGGEVRDRYEFFNHNLFGAGAQDRDGYNLIRILANADMHFGPFVRFFVQGISATEQGNEVLPRPTDVDDVDLHQAFVDLKIPISDTTSFTLRPGRQNLLYGAQRLIGPLDWANVRRTFDGFRGILASPGNNLDLFFVQPVVASKYTFDNDAPLTEFAGVYDTWQIPGAMAKSHAQLEIYGLYVEHNSVATFTSEGTGREERYTVGARFSANPKPFDFDVEPDYQFGDFKGGAVTAWSIASEAGITDANCPLVPRTFIGLDAASGDRSPHSGGLNTFDQLYPTGHLFYGYTDAIGRQNIIDVNPGIDLLLLQNEKHAKNVTLRGEYHALWRESDQDNVYTAAGTVLRASAPGTGGPVGEVADGLMNWQVDRHLSAYMGYSHFFAGEFLRETGAHQDINFFYTAATYKF